MTGGRLAFVRSLVSFSSRRNLLPVTADMRLTSTEVSALLIDLLTYEVYYTTNDQIAVSPRFATIQSFQRVEFAKSSMLNMNVPQVYLTIGCTLQWYELSMVKLQQAISLVDRVLVDNSFAGLGHFDRKGTSSFFCVKEALFKEPGVMDYGRLFVGTEYETIIRRVPSGFDVLNALGLWSRVSMHDVNACEINYCWLIGRQEVDSPYGKHQARIRVSGDDHHWMEFLFESYEHGVTAIEMRGLHIGPGIFLGPRGGVAAAPSLILVNRSPTMTNSQVYTWTTGI